MYFENYEELEEEELEYEDEGVEGEENKHEQYVTPEDLLREHVIPVLAWLKEKPDG